MNFFEHQERARTTTTVLVFYFIIAVVLTNLAVYAGIRGYQIYSVSRLPDAPLPSWWDQRWFIQTCVSVTALILTGMLAKFVELGAGGKRLALSLGGREIQTNTSDPAEKRLLNVVEEMAIASGVRVPSVFIIRHDGINAFAAGWNPQDVALGVTTGTLKLLSRDELQGVVAHEFSHILNGDMRINLRLIGILNGIELMGAVGYKIMRGISRSSSRSSSRGKGASPTAFIFFVGLLLFVVGYIGLFFGMLIRSAISRQREYLADASAVQFTRNPEGIVGALTKIGATSREFAPGASSLTGVSHMLFSENRFSWFTAIFATHPPLLKRIRAINPSFDGVFPEVEKIDVAANSGLDSIAAFAPQQTTRPRQSATSAGSVISEIPNPVSKAVREPFSARAVVLSLLLDRTDNSIRANQLESLRTGIEAELYNEIVRLAGMVKAIPQEQLLVCLDLALPALRALSNAQFEALCRSAHALIQVDGKVSFFEYALYKILARSGKPEARGQSPRIRFSRISQVAPACSIVLSSLAAAGPKEPPVVQKAFQDGASRLGADGSALRLHSFKTFSMKDFDDAIETIAAASPKIKNDLLAACTACILSDGRVHVPEFEMLRVTCAVLGAPMPPAITVDGKSQLPIERPIRA